MKRGCDDDEKERDGEQKALPAFELEVDLAGKLAAMKLDPSDPDWWKRFKKYEDEHAWKLHDDATSFANELRACELEPLSPAEGGEEDAGVCVLRPQTNFLDDATYQPVTFSRACTRELSNVVFEDYVKPRFLLTGNPGTGKSRFLWELLWRALRWSRVVVLEMRKPARVFIFVPPRPNDQDDDGKYRAFWLPIEEFIRARCAALNDKNTLWLIDPEEVKPGSATPNPAELPARTVLAASPNNLHYKGWHKNDLVQTRYMPPWTVPELLTVLPEVKEVKESLLPPGVRDHVEAEGDANRRSKRQVVSDAQLNVLGPYRDAVANVDALNPDEIKERYRQFGGVIRVIFGDVKKLGEYLEAVEKAIATLLGELILEFETAGEIADLGKRGLVQQEDVKRVSSKLFAYQSVSPYEDKTVVPLSPLIQERVVEAYFKRLQKTPYSAVGFGDEFERVAGCYVVDEVHIMRLDGPVKDKNSARSTFPAHLFEEKLVLPRSPYGSPVAVWDKAWKAVFARLKKEFDGAVEPVDLKEGWTRNGHVLKPSNRNQPVLDFFEVIWHKQGDTVTKVPVMYQATVSTAHPMSRTHLVKLLDLLGCTEDSPLVIMFVVPLAIPSSSAIMRFFGGQKEVFDEFRAQTSPNKDTDVEHQRVLNRVVQFKCAVDLHIK